MDQGRLGERRRQEPAAPPRGASAAGTRRPVARPPASSARRRRAGSRSAAATARATRRSPAISSVQPPDHRLVVGLPIRPPATREAARARRCTGWRTCTPRRSPAGRSPPARRGAPRSAGSCRCPARRRARPASRPGLARPRARRAARRAPSSRPISGSCTLASRVRDPITVADAPTPARASALPLTMNGSSSSVANRVPRALEHLGRREDLPGSAFAISRAARFTASPITVYVRRYHGPMSPANTRAAVHADPDRDRRSASAISRSASSIRSSSLPVIVGAPAVRISLPPSSSTSVREEAHAVSSHGRLHVGDAARASSSATRRRALRCSISSSVPSKWMNAIVTVPVLGRAAAGQHVRRGPPSRGSARPPPVDA